VTGFLARACSEAAERVAEAARLVPLDELRAAVGPPPRRAFDQALRAPGVSVIAEVKRSSPSKGHLAWVPDPAAHAAAYARGGAAAISVLTEPAHFSGTLADLAAVAAAVDVPAIRKDFVVDAYQVWEARRAGAAALLLIVAALDDDRLCDLLRETAQAGLGALVEVHDVAEAERAGRAFAAVGAAGPPPVVGVNARDLATLEIDPGRFAACVDALPAGAVTVAESGVSGPQDVARAAAAGADAVLVGEHVVTSAEPEEAVRRLVEAGLEVGPEAPEAGSEEERT
jgi:indole-3-glycerol phosphate synthase